MAVTKKITDPWDIMLHTLVVINVSDQFSAPNFGAEKYPEDGGIRIL
jgi:hypothetical protein